MICIKKLNSRRGAAVIIALLVSFIAALSGTVALVMSSSNAGRAGYNKEEQQAYLSIASAAQLISDTFKNLTATVTVNRTNLEYIGVTYSSKEAGEKEATLFLADDRFKKDLYLHATDTSENEGYFLDIYFTLNLNENVVDVDLDMSRLLDPNVGLLFKLHVENYKQYFLYINCNVPYNLQNGEFVFTFGDATSKAQGGTGSAGGGD